MAYATVSQVAAGFRTLTTDEQSVAAQLLEEAAVIIDAYASDDGVSTDAKSVVSCNMVRRAIGASADQGLPLGASQGSISAGGYSQSWTISNGAAGELYLTKLEKKLLGVGNAIGASNPFVSAGLVEEESDD